MISGGETNRNISKHYVKLEYCGWNQLFWAFFLVCTEESWLSI